MIRPILLTVCLLLASVSAWAKSNPKAKMLSNLLKRCEDGIAVACYDYGVTLSSNRKKAADVKRGKLYIRRACTLAYAPACATRSTVAEVKVKNTAPKVDSKGKPCNTEELAKTAKLGEDNSVAQVSKGSLWEQAGIQPGDEVISVNGKPFSGAEQIGEALEAGGAVLNLKRNGRETSVMLNCP